MIPNRIVPINDFGRVSEMKTFTSKLAVFAVASAALWAGQAVAADLSEGYAGDPEAMRDLMLATIVPINKAKPIAMVRTDEGTSRGVLDDEDAVHAFTVVGKTADGRTIEIAPGENIEKAVKGEIAAQHRDIKPGTDL